MSDKGEVSEVCEPVKKRPRLLLSKKTKKESNCKDDESLQNASFSAHKGCDNLVNEIAVP